MMGRSRTRLYRRVLGFAVGLALVAANAVAESERAELSRKLGADLRRAEEALSAGRTTEAGSLYRAALEEARELGERSLPLARATDGLADALREAGRPAEAEPLYAQAAALWESLLGPTQPRLAVTLHNLGVVRIRMGESAAAAAPLERALEIWTASYGADSPQAQNTRRALEQAGDPRRRGDRMDG